jgi:hypothetical protein
VWWQCVCLFFRRRLARHFLISPLFPHSHYCTSPSHLLPFFVFVFSPPPPLPLTLLDI